MTRLNLALTVVLFLARLSGPHSFLFLWNTERLRPPPQSSRSPILSIQQTRSLDPRRWSRIKLHEQQKIRGDPLREASGIRPSLHPLTINTIAELLKIRAKQDASTPLRIVEGVVEPLQVALSASRIAAEAIQKRQETSEGDGMKLTLAEQQTVAGRVVGVAMRLPELEAELHSKCREAAWIAKYGEWDSFGVLSSSKEEEEDDIFAAVDDRIRMDPLFGMNRAECLLAIFLHQVEAPELAQKNTTVQDNSVVDFLDADRKEVLLGIMYE